MDLCRIVLILLIFFDLVCYCVCFGTRKLCLGEIPVLANYPEGCCGCDVDIAVEVSPGPSPLCRADLPTDQELAGHGLIIRPWPQAIESLGIQDLGQDENTDDRVTVAPDGCREAHAAPPLCAGSPLVELAGKSRRWVGDGGQGLMRLKS
jgi:hypothetical protein